MQCSICSKEYNSTRSDSKFCSSKCRMLASRKKLSVTRIAPLSVTKEGLSVTKRGNSVTDNLSSVTDSVTDKLDKLTFTDENLEERIAIYKKIMGEITFVPNWIIHGFHSKEEAIKHVISEVQKRE